MKKRQYALFLLTLQFLLQTEWLSAQEYLDLWRNAKTDNFYLIQKKFNEYYAGRDRDSGYNDDAYTKFKRWEYFMEPRVYPSGKLINHTKLALDEDLRYRNRTKLSSLVHAGNWQSLGIKYYTEPKKLGGGMGRVNCIVPHPTDPQTLFAGTPGGGLWKTMDGGKNWIPLSDGLPRMGVSGIAINPHYPDSIYILTGDGDGHNTNCTGVLLSTNGGDTWQSTDLHFSAATATLGYKLLMHPTNSNILYAATTKGIYKTANGGVSWGDPILEGSFKDIAFKPGDPSVVYCAGAQEFKVSFDSGKTWETPFTLTSSDRIAIGVSPANPSYVYLLAGSSTGFAGLYRSENSGQNFTLRSNSPNILGYKIQPPFDQKSQSYYDLAIAVSPTDAEEVHIGGINCWKSPNGGTSWLYTSFWDEGKPEAGNGKYTHADIHALVFNKGTLYCASDGGIFRSADKAKSWQNISFGLEITEFYCIAAPLDDLKIVYGAAQDNGVNKWTAPAITMDHQIGGDGIGCVVDYTNENIAYALTAEQFHYTNNGGTEWKNQAKPESAGGQFVIPLIMHPTDPAILYAGYNLVYQITKNQLGVGMDFTPVSPSFETDRRLAPWALAMSANNQNCMYVALPTAVKYCPNINQSNNKWDDITTTTLPVNMARITDIEVSATDATKAWVCFSGYSKGNKVFQTSNENTASGIKWINISGTLPNIPINCIAYHNNGNDGIYIGTDIGVFYRDNTMSDWIPFRNYMPNVCVTDLDITDAKIRAATFGRGIWESDLYGNCGPSYTLSRDVTGCQFFESSDVIISTANIKGGVGTRVKYKAANQITLNPGFKVAPGSKFAAIIGKCTGTQPYQRKYRGIYEGVMAGIRKKKSK